MDAETKVKITFNETKVVQDERTGTPDEERYEVGKTYGMSPRSADRWVKRKVADWASDEDRRAAAGASSDVSLKLQDADRIDPGKSLQQRNTPPTGEGAAADAGEADTGGGEGSGDGKSGGGDVVDYDAKTLDELKASASERGITVEGDTKKDFAKALRRRDKADAAIEAKDWNTLTKDELEAEAEKREFDLGEAKSKAEIVAVFQDRYKD